MNIEYFGLYRRRTKRIHNSTGISHLKVATYENGDVIIVDHETAWKMSQSGFKYASLDFYRRGADLNEMVFWRFHNRTGKPAFIKASGNVYWFIDGTEYTSSQAYCKDCGFSDMRTFKFVLKYGDVLPNHIYQL